jgi:hypothetical protein
LRQSQAVVACNKYYYSKLEFIFVGHILHPFLAWMTRAATGNDEELARTWRSTTAASAGEARKVEQVRTLVILFYAEVSPNLATVESIYLHELQTLPTKQSTNFREATNTLALHP